MNDFKLILSEILIQLDIHSFIITFTTYISFISKDDTKL